MKLIVTLLLFITCQKANAQNLFTQFVNNRNIQWAISSEENIACDSFTLNLFLRQQLSQHKIKASIIDDFETVQTISYINADSVIKRIQLNESSSNPNPQILFSNKYFSLEASNLVEAYQVIYVENGKIKSVVNAISPKHTVVTPNGRVLGLANTFTTGINYNRNLKNAFVKHSIHIATTHLNIFPRAERSLIQKMVYNKDLLTTIWPYLGKSYKIFRLDSLQFISRDELLNAQFHPSLSVNVPVYDVNGNLTHSKIVRAEISPEFFSNVSLEQEWRYNQKANILFNKIVSLTLSFRDRDGKEAKVLKLIPQ
ncbi:MAG TPA: hypothetical protein PK504_09960 [Ferruginibacter sp.]|nr:hypothetical protein [Ferruginibacter sp.]HRE62839.1 hypothetical protein [Ferruginibacter sp.]